MGVDIQGKLRLALGSVKDHASIGKALIMYHHQQDGFSSIEIAVLRATGHDNGTIDDKYMHEILFLVSNSPGSIPFLAEKISRRLNKTKDRLVALKTLVLIHRLLRGGNRSFEQELCKAHVSGHLQISARCFTKNGSSPSSSSDHPCVCFLHKYASYLEERMKWLINQAGKLEPIMSKGLEFRRYDEKSIDMVFRTLPKCQVLIDKVLDCSPVGDVLAYDSLAQTAMSNTLRESFQVYKTFSEGVSALVNMFFDLTASARGLACEILKKASIQSERLHELYQNCKKIVENKNLEYPRVHIISMDHIMAVDRCLRGGGSSISKPPLAPILDHLRRSTELEMAVTTEKATRKKKVHKEDKIDINLSSTLFSWTVLETKISKVWVVFEDEPPNNNESSPQVLEAAQSKFGDIMKSEYSSSSCVLLNPF
ncbi:putative clathrin assembly protein At1g33340 [Neltuma alba]|uniref:putative clathrin assembly protein At1g33340 n=1 Tax=Neltuma alba TaxID=207710 RepID=UPI0010A39BB0|nr:putative clathrin assembly protein At1g33340 [Prosopis alba]